MQGSQWRDWVHPSALEGGEERWRSRPAQGRVLRDVCAGRANGAIAHLQTSSTVMSDFTPVAPSSAPAPGLERSLVFWDKIVKGFRKKVEGKSVYIYDDNDR